MAMWILKGLSLAGIVLTVVLMAIKTKQIKNNAEKANYYAMKTLRKVQKKVGFPERIR